MPSMKTLGRIAEAMSKLSSEGEKVALKSLEIAKLELSGRKAAGEFDVEITSTEVIDGGIQFLARVWDKNGERVGLGHDGTIDIERFRIFNPPIFVPDGTKTVMERTDGSKYEADNLIEDPEAAVLSVLAHTLRVIPKFGPKNIIKGKVGNTTSTFNPASGANSPVDGRVVRAGVDEAWATIRAGAGTSASATETNDQIILRSTATSNQYGSLSRGIFLFDTSAITDTDAISAAVFSLYVTAKTSGIAGCEWGLYASTPAADNTLATGDYANLGTTEFATAIAQGGITTSAYNDWTMNATGIAAISKTGNTKLGVREKNFDAAGGTPTWVSDTQTNIDVNFADSASNDPKLVVTHAAPASGFKNLMLMGVG